MQKAHKIFKNNEYNLKFYTDETNHFLIAFIEKYQNLREQMFKTLERGMKKFPQSQKLKAFFDEEKEIDLKLLTAINYQKSKDYPLSIQLFKEIIALDSSNTLFNQHMSFLLAKALFENRDFGSSLQEVIKSIQGNQTDAERFVLKADIEYQLSMFVEAEASIRKAMAINGKLLVIESKAKQYIKMSKMSQRKDYYKIIGVDRGCDIAEIKKTYRKKALQLHPDRSTEENAKEKFQDLTEAYGVLSDPEKKLSYDNGDDIAELNARFEQESFTDVSDIFQMFFGNMGQAQGRRTRVFFM